jgi:hypothetical protein
VTEEAQSTGPRNLSLPHEKNNPRKFPRSFQRIPAEVSSCRPVSSAQIASVALGWRGWYCARYPALRVLIECSGVRALLLVDWARESRTRCTATPTEASSRRCEYFTYLLGVLVCSRARHRTPAFSCVWVCSHGASLSVRARARACICVRRSARPRAQRIARPERVDARRVELVARLMRHVRRAPARAQRLQPRQPVPAPASARFGMCPRPAPSEGWREWAGLGWMGWDMMEGVDA